MLLTGGINIVKMITLSQATHDINVILIKLTMTFFQRARIENLKIFM